MRRLRYEVFPEAHLLVEPDGEKLINIGKRDAVFGIGSFVARPIVIFRDPLSILSVSDPIS